MTQKSKCHGSSISKKDGKGYCDVCGHECTLMTDENEKVEDKTEETGVDTVGAGSTESEAGSDSASSEEKTEETADGEGSDAKKDEAPEGEEEAE